MDRVKAAAPPLPRSTTSHSRRQKPMPPNARWRLSANRLGLSFIEKAKYRRSRCSLRQQRRLRQSRVGFHPDDTTPIPRPSRYYGRRQSPPVTEHLRKTSTPERSSVAAPPIAPAIPDPSPGKIDKSALTLAEPKRRRDKAHLRFVASQPCLVCGRHPSDPHHLRFAQPRALGVKVSDEFTVPLCRGHHRQLHQAGDEMAWWKALNIDALPVARQLWEQTHPNEEQAETQKAARATDETTTKN